MNAINMDIYLFIPISIFPFFFFRYLIEFCWVGILSCWSLHEGAALVRGGSGDYWEGFEGRAWKQGFEGSPRACEEGVEHFECWFSRGMSYSFLFLLVLLVLLFVLFALFLLCFFCPLFFQYPLFFFFFSFPSFCALIQIRIVGL